MEGTVGEMIKARVEKYGDRTMMCALRDGAWQKISWNQFWSNARRLALGLLSLGIEHGDRVAIFSENSPEWQMVDVAALSIGALDVPLYATITPKQAEYIITDSGSRVVFVGSEKHLEKVLEVRDSLKSVLKIITMDNTKSEHPDVMTFDELMALGDSYANPEVFEQRMEAVKPDDLCSFVYTSGTTGNPKGVMLTHDNFLSNVKSVSGIVKVDDTDVCLSFLPLSHGLERMSGYYTSLYNGATIYHARSADTLLEDIGDVKPHFMVSVPRLYEKFHAGVLSNIEKESPFKQRVFRWAVRVGSKVSELKMNKKAIPPLTSMKYKLANKLVFSQIYKLMGGRLKFFVSGGAPLAKEIAEFFHALGILIIEGYGLTETSPVLTCNRPDDFRFGSVGKPIPGVEIKIAEDGEILAKGPNVMKGYYGREQETAEALADGWFHTGDIGRLDEDGFLYITDRKKDLIVTAGGKNVAPQNIENSLIVDRFIEQVCVIGDKRKFISALVVPNFEELETWAKEQGIDVSDRKKLVKDERVMDFYKKRIDETLKDFDRHERIQKFVLLPEEMTEESGLITPTLKIKRKEVDRIFQKEIEELYAG
ncbi:MAG: long-chain fatty acid--CoA ligase [Actinomycetota bacterium]|nr:long-chain fatty acid--CoA ligase [Actinomycetota bacterium]